MHYDAILYLSFGGPEGMDDVMPYLDNVLRGRRVPEARKQEVAHHYESLGGCSPINAQNREVIGALEAVLRKRGLSLPVYFGNRNWHPLLADTVRKMADDGIRRALAFVTSAYSSYSGCRQYLEDIAAARSGVGEQAPEIEKIRVFYNHPLFIEANADRLRASLDRIPESDRAGAVVLFSAHSVPRRMAEASDYELQLGETCRLLADRLEIETWELVYQSRSGSPNQPWLEPDVCDELERLAGEGTRHVAVMPFGFLSDHMEVLFDLDTEAVAKAEELGIELVRAGTVGSHPAYVSMIAELIGERINPGSACRALGNQGPRHHECPGDCCRLG
jgi:ferrochelatase